MIVAASSVTLSCVRFPLPGNAQLAPARPGMRRTLEEQARKQALQIKDELGTSYTDLRKIESGETESKIQSIIFQNTGATQLSHSVRRM